ncbi:hypothetical protein COF62_29185 [Bacillus toyonensis]|uniref:histidine kinase n=1 Tax=Bacillus toyonensis TaxID=155322 RepID=A0AAP8EYI2_9BACI|nr:sortase [Bacillus toyonensis]PEB90195.1 hypothetical protein CON81_26625 [Bacillus toyonensis]PHE06217.1 hypothetical protein COF62_29185 [Bacillus toyonensis]
MQYKEGEKVTVLNIPKIVKKFSVYWGANDTTLKKGVGMFVSDSTTTKSESGGHIVLSGHRDTVFTNLRELKEMDNLIVENDNKVNTYEIHKMWITNAIRYTPNKEDIIISTIDEPNRVKICIENKGAHIEEDQLDKIWDRFYRVDTARQRSQGGTGLGLAISKNILELHEAEYGVNNTVDGVLFHFYLSKKV